MKLCPTLVLLFCLLAGVSALGQGQLVFANSRSSEVYDCPTLGPVGTGVATAGLYYSLDLQAYPEPFYIDDGWILAATTPVAPSPVFAGLYNGGTISIPSAPAGTMIKVQVRAWSQAYSSWAEALAHGTYRNFLAFSDPLTLTLGGGGTIIPIPALSASGISGMYYCPIPEPGDLPLVILATLALGGAVWARNHSTASCNA